MGERFREGSGRCSWQGLLASLLVGLPALLLSGVPPLPAQSSGVCARTAAVQTALVAASGVAACADVTASHLEAITALDLSGLDIESLSSGDFADLTSLHTLDLSANLLTALPADLFAPLSALEALYLDHNDLTALPAGVFDELTLLDEVTLHDNLLESLPQIFRDSAEALDAAAAAQSVQYYSGFSLERGDADAVDYFTFTLEERSEVGLGVRGQSIDLLAYLEDARGNEMAVSGPPLDPNKDQTIEWLLTTLDAGTYYIRVEAQEDGQTDYYLRFGLTDAPEPTPAAHQAAADEAGLSAELTGRATDESVRLTWDISGTGYIYDMYVERLDAGNQVELSDWVAGELSGDEESSWVSSDYGLEPGTPYRYRVRLDTADHGDVFSNVLVLTTETEPPLAPADLAATATHATVALSWRVPEQPAWVTAVAFMRVLRTQGNGPRVEVGRVAWQRGVQDYALTDASVYPGRTYRYVIEADIADRLHRSGEVAVTTGPLPTDPDATRAGAVPLDAAAAAGRMQRLYYWLNRQGGDSVDYYTFTTTARYRLTFGVRQRFVGWDERVHRGVRLEDAGGHVLLRSSAPADPRAETLETVLEAGTYYVRLEAWEEGFISYFIKFSLTAPTAEGPNDPPAFGASAYDFSIDEDAGVGAVVGRVWASDPDGDAVAYAITSGNGAGPFAIDSGTGVITVAAALDYETASSYALTVQAADGHGGTTTATVTVTVTAVPEDEPATALERLLTAGPAAAVETGTTPDGVPYVQFLKEAPVASRQQQDPGVMMSRQRNSDGGNDVHVELEYISPRGLWSDGTTLWVTGQEASTEANAKLFAYVLDTGARDSAKDIDLDTTITDNATGLWMDEDTAWVSSILPKQILGFHREADVTWTPPIQAGDRKRNQDFTVWDKSYATPLDLWSDGSSMYVATGGYQIHIYDLATRTYQKRLLTRAPWNTAPVGTWSNGITMWVVDSYVDKVFAYRLHDWAYDHDFSMDLSEDNRSPRGMWSDGMQLWVMDERARKVFIYDLPDDPNLDSLEASDVNLAAFTPETTSYTRNVAGDITHVTVDAVALREDASVTIAPADDDPVADGHQVRLVTNGVTTVTIAVTDGDAVKNYTLTLTQLADTTGTLSDDDSLSALSLSGFTLNETFESDALDYQAAMTEAQFNDGLTTTVTATPNNSGATVTITPADGDDNTAGHQITTESGRITAEIAVTSQDGSSTRTYTVELTTIVRAPNRDFRISPDVSGPYDMWSDGETMWVLGSFWDLRAHDLETGNRLPNRDYDQSQSDHIDHDQAGMWSDGDTIWISDLHAMGPPWVKKRRPYHIEAIDAQSHDPIRNVPSQYFLPRDTSKGVRDLWSDGETFWVIWGRTAGSLGRPVIIGPPGGKLRAYDFQTKARKPDADIAVTTTGRFLPYRHTPISFGLWSDGTTIWVVSSLRNDESKLEAYSLTSGDRLPARDILVGKDGFLDPRSMWSDGRNMWVLNVPENYSGDSRAIAYTLPPNAKLFSLAMSDVEDFGHFIHGKPKYTATVANDVDETTITYEQAFTGGSAAVAIKAVDPDDNAATTDADTETDGYQVDLAEGENVIAITVTAPNGTDTYAYTVTITRAEE